jgi:hypothetical protein
MSWGGCGEAKDSRGTPHRSPLSSGEPNRETTAGRDPLRRHAHFFAAAALSYYPSTRLHLVDTAINGTTCPAWSKGSPDKAARIAVLSGQGLPTPPQTDDRLVHLVKDTRNEPAAVQADQVYVGQSATNLVMATNADPVSVSSGGSPTRGSDTASRWWTRALKPLGFTTASAQQAPWALIRTFAPGPALSREDATTQHDTLAAVAGAEALPTKTSEH